MNVIYQISFNMVHRDYFLIDDTDRFGNHRIITVYYKDSFEVDDIETRLHNHDINVTSVTYMGREIWNYLTTETKENIYYEIEKRIAGY